MSICLDDEIELTKNILSKVNASLIYSNNNAKYLLKKKMPRKYKNIWLKVWEDVYEAEFRINEISE